MPENKHDDGLSEDFFQRNGGKITQRHFDREGAQETERSGVVCDDPRVVVGPDVLSESER